MGVRILSDAQDYSGTSHAVLYCSTGDWAFGPVFYGDGEHEGQERAEAFIRWCGEREPRRMTDSELEQAYGEWLKQESAQWRAEEEAAQECIHCGITRDDPRHDQACPKLQAFNSKHPEHEFV